MTSTTGQSEDESRVFVVADADIWSDRVFRVTQGNAVFLRDIITWLQRKSETIVPTNDETDVRIVHAGVEDAVVFYSTTFGIPIALILIGAFATRRRQK